eukprot:scaffold42317_cov27-Prasinocladus_malaysianus.AAC.3
MATYLNLPQAAADLPRSDYHTLWRALDAQFVNIVLAAYSQALANVLLPALLEGEKNSANKLEPLLELARNQLKRMAPTQAAASTLVYVAGYHVSKTIKSKDEFVAYLGG